MHGLLRRLAYGLLLTPFVGVAAVAQLPPNSPPAQESPLGKVPIIPVPAPTTGSVLRGAPPNAVPGAARDNFLDESGMAARRTQLMGELKALLNRLETRPPATLGPNPSVPPRTTPSTPLPEGKSVDALREAMNRFRDNDFEVANGIFRLIDTNPLPRDERAFVNYMRACCLRRLNRPNEAAVLYREIADSRDDDFITDCAIWQLSMIRQSQDLEAELEQIRARTKSR